MKIYYIKRLGFLITLLFMFNSCDLDRLDSAQAVADGGGTVDTFMAYTLESTDMETNVSGRVVFWKTELDQTLVEIALVSPNFETLRAATPLGEILSVSYPSEILSGTIGGEEMVLTTLFDVELDQQIVSLTTEMDTEDLDGDGDVEELLPDVGDFDRDGDLEEVAPTAVRFFAEFGESEFFLITDETFYDNLPEFDAHINIYNTDGTTIIAAGDIGVNADPVQSN